MNRDADWWWAVFGVRRPVVAGDYTYDENEATEALVIMAAGPPKYTTNTSGVMFELNDSVVFFNNLRTKMCIVLVGQQQVTVRTLTNEVIIVYDLDTLSHHKSTG